MFLFAAYLPWRFPLTVAFPEGVGVAWVCLSYFLCFFVFSRLYHIDGMGGFVFASMDVLARRGSLGQPLAFCVLKTFFP